MSEPGKVDAKLGLDVFKLDKEPHIVIDHEVCRTVCTRPACLPVCPADLYELRRRGRHDRQLGGLPGVRHLPDLLRRRRRCAGSTRAAASGCSTA